MTTGYGTDRKVNAKNRLIVYNIELHVYKCVL